VELPELAPSPADPTPPDVVVRVGPVPDTIADPVTTTVVLQVAPGVLRLAVPGVATFLVTGGSEVTIDPVGGEVTKDARLFLYGSAIGAALQQRGILTLHASAVTDGQRALVFAGLSGHGKSTLAAALTGRGHRLLTDDVVALLPGPAGGSVAAPGYPWIKLWADAVDRLAIASDGLTRVRDGLDKSYWPAPPPEALDPVPVEHVIVLRIHNGDDFVVEPVTGGEKLGVLHRNTYRRQFVAGTHGAEGHFAACVALARDARVTRIVRPATGFRIDELCELVLDVTAPADGPP